MKMKKLVTTGPKKTTVIEVDAPVITKPDEVLIKVKYCGVCMSEHYNWSIAKEGLSFGHEPMGVVCEVGEAVTGVKVGDRVSGLFPGGCEYAVATEKNVFKLADNVTNEQGVLEPLSCLISAVSKVRLPMIGTQVAVVGCGYMGCGAISLLKLRGAYVVAVDIRRESLENAKRYGADECYTPDELPASYLTVNVDHNNHEAKRAKMGFDAVMEWGETEQSLALAINMTAMCGQLCIGAYHNNNGGMRNVNVQQLNVKAIDMLSTHPREADMNIFGCEEGARLLAEGKWSFCNVPTKVYPITQFDLAQEELETKYGKFLKSVVDFEMIEGEAYIVE